MTATDWYTPWAKAIGMSVEASPLDEHDDRFYIAFNSHSQRIPFTIPGELGRSWRVIVNTAEDQATPIAGSSYSTLFCVEAHSLLIVASSP
jgi:pullulanase/glycogen debranching enzyme